MEKNPSIYVKLKLYRGKPSYNEKGELQSESQFVKLPYDSMEYSNFLKNCQNLGFTKVEIIDIYNVNEDADKKKVTKALSKAKPQVAQDLINIYLVPEKELTKDQLTIKRLEEKIDAIAEGKSKPKKEKAKKEEPIVDEDEDEEEEETEEETEGEDEETETDDSFDEEKEYSEEEIEVLREKYLKAVGEKPHHKAGPEKLIEGINASKAE